jgi:predicted Fe-Mo cluster-binding NifX family protein
MRIVIPVEEDRGLDSRLSEHFGRTSFLLVLEIDDQGRV